jgi:hypothetical protein
MAASCYDRMSDTKRSRTQQKGSIVEAERIFYSEQEQAYHVSLKHHLTTRPPNADVDSKSVVISMTNSVNSTRNNTFKYSTTHRSESVID